MAFDRKPFAANMPQEDEQYFNQTLSPEMSPHSRPMDYFPFTKEPQDFPANWAYDGTMDMFPLDPVDMNVLGFPEYVDGVNDVESNGLFMDPFNASTAIGGLSMPTADDAHSISSEFESDDQSWSFSARPSVDMTAASISSTTSPDTVPKPFTRSSVNSANSTSPSASTRSSSSPEIKPQEYKVSRIEKRRKPRSVGTGEAEMTAPVAESTPASAKDPQNRNAAKRAAHNIIEKRYRTNMNAKFLALEQAISTSSVQKSSRASAGAASAASAGSLKKSEILSNALAYIERIQQENLAAQKELALLKEGLVAGGMWRSTEQGRS
ncbi:Basic-region helix-loop-helix (bHLH) transcription factor [Penicillium ucsense]|uniref:Basic-region helix-loop-helix (BHLH) transcription factor n=1 Tax=Penicillium ucsense TaxID=2839758 RepID=A0A8J8W0V4_9EURO|nr:Basic-region helix-loop-helix (bHLH) transcription factor [Penicillium ucsense]KAF7735132.1 Basic-region helix-loop-helix (bHLH) transcription factor [Penicillium ucsense]